MRKLLFTFVGIVTVEFLVAPLGGRVFDHFFPEERGFAGMMPDVPFYQWGYASILALGLVVGVGITRWQDKRTKSRAGGGPIAFATPTDKPIGSPSPSRLPTAAELLQEQELCDTMRAIREFIEGSGNEARSDLSGIIIEVVRLYSYQQSKICKALKFFVQDATNLGYTENMKEIIADIRQSLGDRSIDRVQQNLAAS